MRRSASLVCMFVCMVSCGEEPLAPTINPPAPAPRAEGQSCGPTRCDGPLTCPPTFCGAGLVCEAGRCAKPCAAHADCLAGQRCIESLCLTLDPLPEPQANPLYKLWGARCDAAPSARDGAAWELDLDIPPDTEAATIVLLGREDWSLADTLTTPDGTEYKASEDFNYNYIAAGSRGAVGTYADVVSYMLIQLPQRHRRLIPLDAGRHTVRGDGAPPCVYVIPEARRAAPQRIDLNVHLVALDLDAAEAARIRFVQRYIAPIQAKLEVRDMALGEVRLIDAPAWMRQRYNYVRTPEQYRELLAYGQHAPQTRSDSLAIDVFIVTDLLGAFLDRGGPLGASGSIAGPPGLHGNMSTGIVLSLVQSSEEDMPHTLMHEIGHYMGLFHTTEINGMSYNPFIDTPTCPDLSTRPNVRGCPDAGNIMFPYHLGAEAASFSLQQGQHLLDNAHSQPAP